MQHVHTSHLAHVATTLSHDQEAELKLVEVKYYCSIHSVTITGILEVFLRVAQSEILG